MRWDAWVTVLAGVWLLIAPFATGYNPYRALSASPGARQKVTA